MRFLVTGATGFIGSHLCERLIAHGHEVVALVRSPAKAERLQTLGVEMLPGDLSLFERSGVELPRVDIVVHLAAVVSAPTLDDYDRINYRAVVSLVERLAEQSWTPRRLLFASSLAASGPSPANRDWTEADTPAPCDPYGDAKARAERYLLSAPFPVTCVRPPIVLGPGDPAMLPLFKAAARGLGFRVAGPPQKLSYIFVDDLVDAMMMMVEDSRAGHRIYFAAAPEPIDTRSLWTELAAAFDKRALVVQIPRPVLLGAMHLMTAVTPRLGWSNPLDRKQYEQMIAPAFLCSARLLEDELGWKARTNFGQAALATARGYRALGWL